MDPIIYQHNSLAQGGWENLKLSEQLANIGSEVSRALKAKEKNKPDRVEKAIFRALELFDLTITVYQKSRRPGVLQEICRAREEVCDYFLGNNNFNTDPKRLMRYYDQFALLRNN